ncbi:hypothetical protein ASG24_06945 [Methylophilus sp. Leaf414]|nr:hypothetical protein ASG24_06945 [Methylophilus sp. Leaf414]
MSIKDLTTVLFIIVAIGIVLQLLCCIPFSKRDYFRRGSYMDVMKNIRKENSLLRKCVYYLSYLNIFVVIAMFALSFVK